MTTTKAHLLDRLRKAVTPIEWEHLSSDSNLIISAFNRRVLLELKDTILTDGSAILEEETISALSQNLETYLAEYLKEKPDGWKWILLSCLYLTFIAERPMHSPDAVDLRITEEAGKKIYECPYKSDDKENTCHFCVCRRMSNYEIMKRQMQKEFLTYDQENMIQKFHLLHDETFIFLDFLGRSYRIQRCSGKIFWSTDSFLTSNEADYNEAMTIYDLLCYAKENCHPAGEFVNMNSLSSIQGSSHSVGNGLFDDTARYFDHKSDALSHACEQLNGIKLEKGEIAYQIPFFDVLSIVFQFWNSDEDFTASLQLFTDKNILDYMHYETVWLAMSHLLHRIKEELQNYAAEKLPLQE